MITIIAGRRRQDEAERLESAFIEAGVDNVIVRGSEGEPPDTLEVAISWGNQEWHLVPA